MKNYLILALLMFAGHSYAEHECKLKSSAGADIDYANYISHTGGCKDGYADGHGITKYTNGDHYEGDHKNGQMHGNGVYIWNSGESYRGDYKNGLRHGKGVYAWTDGERYDGEWRENKRSGFGVWYDKSGSEYKSVFYIGGVEIMECSKATCDPEHDAYPLVDQKIKTDILMAKITNALKAEKYKDAAPYFEALDRKNLDLPESFYFYHIQTLSKLIKGDVLNSKITQYLNKYGSDGKYYAEVLEIVGR